MTRSLLLFLLVLPLIACASARIGQSSIEPVVVRYGLILDKNDMLQLSVYNPNDNSVCTSFTNWPGPEMGGDILRVVGRDGQSWKYTGAYAYTVGRAQDLKIPPRSEVTTKIDIRMNYKSLTADTRIGMIYYGTSFRNC